MRNKKSAVITIRRRKNYPRVRACHEFLKFFEKNLTVPKIVAECRKNKTLYIEPTYTLS